LVYLLARRAAWQRLTEGVWLMEQHRDGHHDSAEHGQRSVYQTLTKTGGPLKADQHVLRLVIDGNTPAYLWQDAQGAAHGRAPRQQRR
jgi:hypothetical protein